MQGMTASEIVSQIGEYVDTTNTSIVPGIVQRAQNAVQALGDSVANVAKDVLTSATAALATLSFKGTMGNKMTVTQPISLCGKFMVLSENDTVLHGRPLCQKTTINTLSGFVLCDSASIAIAGTTAEEQAIENFMNRGFFYE